jgi:hypothetical protein
MPSQRSSVASPILSICIPTVSHRAGLLSRLLWSIGEQMERWVPDVEVLVHPGDDIPYGDKLNRMFAQAKGDYVVAVGDDDWLASDYFSHVMHRGFDYIGYKILYLNNRKFQYEISHTADIVGWPTNRLRGVCQTCPVRTSIAQSVPFGNEYFDDRKWSARVGQQVINHLFINRVLYYYDYGDSIGTTPEGNENWVDNDRVGTWDYKFPWWDWPTWLST